MGFLTDNATGEQDVLATQILQQLAQIRTTVHGLTDEQLRATPAASALSLGWLVLHTGNVASQWGGMAASGKAPDYTETFYGEELAPHATLAQLLATFDEQVATLKGILRGPLDLDAPVEIPDAPWFPKDLESWETRWVLAHIIAEVARHAGHADIIRETIDGKTAYELNDLAEGKEPVDWANADWSDSDWSGS